MREALFEAACSVSNLLELYVVIRPGSGWSKGEKLFWGNISKVVDDFVE